MNATIENITIDYKKEAKSDRGIPEEKMTLASKKDLKGNQVITLTTEGLTLDPDNLDEFIKMLKKFKDQATGK